MAQSPREALIELTRQLSVQLAWQRDLGLLEVPLSGALPMAAVAEALVVLPDAVVTEVSAVDTAPVAVAERVDTAPTHPYTASEHLDTAPGPLVTADRHLVTAPGPLVTADAPVVTAPPAVVTASPAVVTAPAPAPRVETPRSPLRTLFGELSPASTRVVEPPPGRLEGPSRVHALTVVQEKVSGCTACGLHKGRRNTVFSRGNPFARLVFVGEGPGEQEDKSGLPFVGPAGQLLDRVIRGMGLNPDEDVYVANVVKCRPPFNRNPEPDEMDTCGPYLDFQLGVMEPEVIVCLGKIAAGYLLKNHGAMTRMRGKWFEYKGIAVMPTWHPSYVLRDADRPGSTARREVWEDMKLVLERLKLPVPVTKKA